MTTAKEDDGTQIPKKAEPGASWRDKEEHVLPENRLSIVFLGLMTTLFLAALDQTIVATALPTIVAELGGGNSYSWVGSAYMLGGAAFGTLYGKLSNMFGRKPILYSTIVIFLFGSAMCGAAQNMNWLIACRAIQGVGGGGIIQLVMITISDIVPLNGRGLVMGLVGVMDTIASVSGPLLGGAFAQHVSWRWCFFINLPTGGVAAAILFMFLNLNPHQSRPVRDQVAEVDFIGLVCLVAGVVCLLIGFDFSQTNWSQAKTIAPLVVGVVLLILGAINEVFTTRSAILPARLFKTRTTTIILLTNFLNAFVFFAVSYYLTLFYQVLGASATGAGVKMLPFSIGSSIANVVSGFVVEKTGKYRPTIWVAYTLMTLGTGLMIMLDYTSSLAAQGIFPLIVSLGVGNLFQIPMVALQATMPLKDMATASGSYWFLRQLGGAIGIAVGEAIITSVLPKKLAAIPNIGSLNLGTSPEQLNESIGSVHLIPDITLRHAVLSAWSQTIRILWILSTPLLGFCLILTLFIREYSLNRKVVRSGDVKNSDKKDSEKQDVEKQNLDDREGDVKA